MGGDGEGDEECLSVRLSRCCGERDWGVSDVVARDACHVQFCVRVV